MANSSNFERTSLSDVARSRALMRDTIPAVVTLIVAQGSLILLDPEGGASAWNLLWSLLPLLPAAWLVWAQVRSIRRADEFQRLLQLESLSIGFGAVVLISLTGGLLDAAGIGTSTQYLQITFIAGILAWLGSLAILNWRAR